MPVTMRPGNGMLWLVVFAAAVLICACNGPKPEPPAIVPDGDPVRGLELTMDYGCVSCHVIPGAPQAEHGDVGPPLNDVAHRWIIAGMLPNSSENMQRWIRDPQGVDPGNVMPDLGVTERDARDLAAYLFTLR